MDLREVGYDGRDWINLAQAGLCEDGNEPPGSLKALKKKMLSYKFVNGSRFIEKLSLGIFPDGYSAWRATQVCCDLFVALDVRQPSKRERTSNHNADAGLWKSCLSSPEVCALATSDEAEERLDVNSVWENIRDNIKYAAEQSIGCHETKKKKPWFDEDCSIVVDRRKQAKLKFLQDPIKENRDNYFNERREASRTLRNKKRDYLKEELNEVETNSKKKKKNIRDLYKGIKESAIKDPALQATNTKWKWGGHVARLRDGRWTQTVTLWDPRIGNRSRGRPRRRWAALFSERVGSHWSSRARNREDWRNLRRQVNSD
ncbi:hypothetical protein ANN_13695 [Periplaneta americana]|uniref:Uncharacterized protein n=1 Tax=Periplaneta americana TaxID=6978 RepID=A0ABQ8SUD8_PERAM|nr:hypothetical protein ANN_13695 [Periplaneta americana]